MYLVLPSFLPSPTLSLSLSHGGELKGITFSPPPKPTLITGDQMTLE